MAINSYLPGLEPINTMNNPVWNPITQTFEYGKSATAEQPGLPGWDIYDKPGLPSGYPGTSGSLNKRYVSVPEGMRETISDATYFDEVNAPNYMGARSPITYPNQRWERPLEAELPSRRGTTSGMTYNLGFPTDEEIYDPAFGNFAQWDKWNTSYPGSFEKRSDYNDMRQIPRLQRDDFYRNFQDQGITGLDVQETISPEKLTILDEERSGPVIESDDEEEIVGEGITSPNQWQKFLSKITRQPYRPAMGGVTMGSGQTYSPAQLNKMNALGGWYSEPARAADELKIELTKC